MALFLGAFSLLAPAGASAAALVSNVNSILAGSTFLNVRFAQRFTTGSNRLGYTLTSIETILTATPAANMRAELWSVGTSGNPGAKLADLTVPAALPTVANKGTHTFVAPVGTELEAGTSYFFVIYNTASVTGGLSLTSSDAEDSGAAAGWSIGNHYRYLPTYSGAVWTISSQAMIQGVQQRESLYIRVNGSAKTVLGGGTGVVLSGGTPTTPGTTDVSSRLHRYVGEGAGGAAFYVKLFEAPTANVVITPYAIPGDVLRQYGRPGRADAITITPATLTFTPTNWNTTQLVTVGGTQDDDARNEFALIILGVSSGPEPYKTQAAGRSAVWMTVNDDDEATPKTWPTLALRMDPACVVKDPQGQEGAPAQGYGSKETFAVATLSAATDQDVALEITSSSRGAIAARARTRLRPGFAARTHGAVVVIPAGETEVRVPMLENPGGQTDHAGTYTVYATPSRIGPPDPATLAASHTYPHHNGINPSVIAEASTPFRIVRPGGSCPSVQAGEGPDPGAPQQREPLTATFEEMPETHDGKTFAFKVRFSETLGASYSRTLRAAAFAVTRGEIKSVEQIAAGLWQVRITPASAETAVAVTLAGGRDCDAAGAVCSSYGVPLSTTSRAAVTAAPQNQERAPGTPAPEPQQRDPLTAAFEQVPAAHDGTDPFWVNVRFSEALGTGGTGPTAASFAVKPGKVKRVRQLEPGLWRVRLVPASWRDLTVTLADGRACDATGAVCTADGRALSTPVRTTIGGPVRLKVKDGKAREGRDATLDFAVTLNRAAPHAVTVDYATQDGTATAGADYTATSGTLTFAPGETAQTVAVPLLDDAHDEGKETFVLTLSNPQGAYLRNMHRQATGTIKNDDPLQRAWLSRFGRTAATHVTDAVSARLRETPGEAAHVTIGGYQLPLRKLAAGQPDTDEPLGTRLTAMAGALLGLGPGAGSSLDTPWAGQPDPRLNHARTLPTVRLREVLQNSAFRLSLNATDAGTALPRLTAWGRFAGTTFDGQEHDLTLDGDVFTGTVGVDGTWDRWLAGVAVAHSQGTGGYTQPVAAHNQGALEQTLTSIHPYLRYAVTDRLNVWGTVGYGWGQLDLEMKHNGTVETVETDTDLVMGAFGGRGVLLAPAETGGFTLATRTDAMLTRTSADAVTGPTGNLAAHEADAHRLRVILEGSRAVTWEDGRSLTPTLELGVRHDWGDAETGFGVELGGRVAYADPTLGLTIDGTVRALLAHEDDAYQEWGASGTIRLAPGAAGQGLALTVAPSWGVTGSGVEGLWARQTTQGLAPGGPRAAPGGRVQADVGYGVPAFGTGLLTPYAGTVLGDGAVRRYRVGTRLQVPGSGATGLTLDLAGTRQEPTGAQPVNQGLSLQATWGF